MGLEMIFSLVSSAQEWLNIKWDEFKKEEENREQKKLKEIEEAERVMFFFLSLSINIYFGLLTSSIRVCIVNNFIWFIFCRKNSKAHV